MTAACPFCRLPRERILHEADTALALHDGYPVSPGHTLVIPRRHVASFFEITDAECADLMSLLAAARDDIDRQFHPAGYNIGINDGAAAGQTVQHLHIHLIPRYEGDRDDPRGGVRWVLPDKAAYWNQGLTVGEVRDSGIPPPYLPTRTSRPSPEDQVRFIANIERILSEGSFVATYKYALLVALVELAIERGDDSNRELVLSIRDIADKFAELYWRQAAPYEATGVSGPGFVLHQNTGRQAGAITRLARLRDELKGSRSTLAEARRTADWKRLVGQMQTLLKTMPLWRLQRVGHEDNRFLYEPGPGASNITLLPGVACHLRERAPLIRRLAETEWLRFVLSLEQNQPVLGRAVGLSEFLFGSGRAALSLKVSKPLRELQDGECFYCQHKLPAEAAVDHFIPWSRYPRDLAHNLVLAHGACNSRKSDLLGGEMYLERWAQFLSEHDSDLLQIGTEAGLLVDRATSVAVAEWSYGHAERVQAQVWLGGTKYGHLAADWRRLLPPGSTR